MLMSFSFKNDYLEILKIPYVLTTSHEYRPAVHDDWTVAMVVDLRPDEAHEFQHARHFRNLHIWPLDIVEMFDASRLLTLPTV